MAKKKATMTLKDFHGGSIPSDLPLPSAPGVTVRPMDRPVFDRPGQWGNPMGRSNHPLRPVSAGSVRNKFDDKAPFLGPNTHIGRNFDEDERKPLDGGSAPRRTVSDDSIRPLPTSADVAKPKPPSQQFSSSSSSSSSYAGKVFEAPYGGAVGSRPYLNAWATRKEVSSVADVVPVPRLGPDAVAKLAHASALDKVSSGRWQSNKQQIHHPVNVEPIRVSEVERSYHSADVERNLVSNDKIENLSHGSKFVGSVTPSPALVEQLERPKLKVFPRAKPLDSSEAPIDHNQGNPRLQNYDMVHNATESYETAKNNKPVLSVADKGNLAVERPKLNLKPRSQALEPVAETTEKERNGVFGGARPRELVLKERGLDDIVVNNHDVLLPPNRVKQDPPRTETASPHITHSRYNGKPEGIPIDNRTKKNNSERIDNMQKRNWQSEKQRTTKHPLHQHQPPQERPPSPETWRKPVEEEPRPTSSDTTGLRYKKAASAVELAQAFSKSVSDPKMAERFPNQRGVPFSRLTSSGSRPQINGY